MDELGMSYGGQNSANEELGRTPGGVRLQDI